LPIPLTPSRRIRRALSGLPGALAFAAADGLPLAEERPVRLGDALATARDRERDGWTLVVDADDAPLGWVGVGRLYASEIGSEVTTDLLDLGGTLASIDGTLREALDAALSSPSGRGVVVDQVGRLAGTVTPSQVLERIERHASLRHQCAANATAAAMGSLPGHDLIEDPR